MKKLNFIAKLLILLLIVSCSTDSVNDISEDDATFDKSNEVNNVESRLNVQKDVCENTVYVFVEYDFSVPGTPLEIPVSAQEQIKIDFRNYISTNFFTVCEVTESNCNFYERWAVSAEEYNDHQDANGDGPIYGQGSGIGVVKPRGGSSTPEDENGVACVLLP